MIIKHYFIFYLILLSQLLSAQSNIAKQAEKADKENPRSELTKVKIRTDKYAFYDKNYTGIKHKYVYFLNTEDEEIAKFVKKAFVENKIEAINFHDLKKPPNYTEEQLEKILANEGVDGFININVTSKTIVIPQTSTYVYNYGAYSFGKTTSSNNRDLMITTYIDFYDNVYGDNPFVRVIATSESSRMNVAHLLVEKNLDYALDGLIRKYQVLKK